jgi:hypothetical protein
LRAGPERDGMPRRAGPVALRRFDTPPLMVGVPNLLRRHPPELRARSRGSLFRSAVHFCRLWAAKVDSRFDWRRVRRPGPGWGAGSAGRERHTPGRLLIAAVFGSRARRRAQPHRAPRDRRDRRGGRGGQGGALMGHLPHRPRKALQP